MTFVGDAVFTALAVEKADVITVYKLVQQSVCFEFGEVRYVRNFLLGQRHIEVIFDLYLVLTKQFEYVISVVGEKLQCELHFTTPFLAVKYNIRTPQKSRRDAVFQHFSALFAVFSPLTKIRSILNEKNAIFQGKIKNTVSKSRKFAVKILFLAIIVTVFHPSLNGIYNFRCFCRLHILLL